VPEGLEIELYRRHADLVVGRRITEVSADDAWYVNGLSSTAFNQAFRRRSITSTEAIGKLLILHTDGPHRLGLRFGMTGRLVVDGAPGIGTLEYSSARLDPLWNRFGLRFAGGGTLTMNDPRRLGRAELDPDTSSLGPDARSLTLGKLRSALAKSGAPLKARLMDQHRIAGLGNLLTDEVLWRARISPERPAAALDPTEVTRLHRTIRATLPQLLDRGGSHTGDLMVARSPDGHCPRCGVSIRRTTVGGRTTYWCPAEQH
jgi:formamidopyrimidine-DNA glycosylase